MPEATLLSKPVLLALINRLQDAAFAIKDGRFVFVNQSCIELFGYSEEEMLSRPIFEFVHPDDGELVKQRYSSRLAGKNIAKEYEFRIITKAGDSRDILMRVDLATEEDGSFVSIGSLRDLSESKRVQQALERSQADLESILSNLPDVFYRTDMQGILTLISSSVVDLLGYTPEETMGKPLSDFYCSSDERHRIVQALIDGQGKARQVEAWLRHKDGHPVWISTNARIRLDENGQPVCVEGIARNRTDAKELEQRLINLAKYDELTQVLNRRAFLETAEREIDIAYRYNRSLVIAMIDLDKFKAINDSFGHHMGDEALIYFADSCQQIFRKTDIICRMGGEEFAVLMPETDIADAADVMERLRQRLRDRPMRFASDNVLKLTFSAGLVSLIDNDGSTESMLKRADRLLYQAKENGRDQVIKEDWG